jgi:hypothetical protein
MHEPVQQRADRERKRQQTVGRCKVRCDTPKELSSRKQRLVSGFVDGDRRGSQVRDTL